ncbi:MAG TPA: enoyl-CoA hydratase-related protein [Burkholderiales bacterium]|nr:enoyl-CoA hydratase-related protein [Burkholderiales bacterium]
MVRYTVDGPVGIVTFDRPDARNALTQDDVEALREILQAFERSEERVLIISGEGGCFTAGADLRNPPKNFARGVPGIGVQLTKPVIAAVSGWCIGGGMVLVTMCDLCVADESARFWFPEARLGRGGGMITALTARIPYKLAMEIMLLGEAIDASQAKSAGLVNRVTAPGAHLDEALALARKIASNAPLVLRMLKRFALATVNRSPPEVMAMTRDVIEEIAGSDDCAEGIRSFKEKRGPQFTGK